MLLLRCIIHIVFPAGNYVLAAGGVDFGLWSSQVLAPGQQWVTGTKPDGSPSYASYDPTGGQPDALQLGCCSVTEQYMKAHTICQSCL
jgi:hypothetical protein